MTTLTDDDVAVLTGAPRPARRPSADGPWTAAVLELIADRPASAPATSPTSSGVERLAFKTDVRKLKALGLTESLEVGLPPLAARPGVAGTGDAAAARRHGGDGAASPGTSAVAVERVIDLSMSASTRSRPTSAPLVAAACSTALGRYPDPAAATAALAAAIGVAADRVVLTNGGAEAIALVAAELGAATSSTPSSRCTGGTSPRSGPARGGGGRTRRTRSAGWPRRGDAAAVWDEAFWPLATGTWTRGDDAAWRLGSLTKLWACPGLRLGYVIAPDGRAAAADRRPPAAVGRQRPRRSPSSSRCSP